MNAETGEMPFLMACPNSLTTHFRVRFQSRTADAVAAYICALESALLFVNGKLIARIGENSSKWRVYAQRVVLPLAKGDNEIHLVAWRLGEFAAYSRTAEFCGVAVKAVHSEYSALLDSGKAPWESVEGEGVAVRLEHIAATAGYPVTMDWRALVAPRKGWYAATTLYFSLGAPQIFPSMLPRQEEKPWSGAHAVFADNGDDSVQIKASKCNRQWQKYAEDFVSGKKTTIPANTTFRALVDLGKYGCTLSSFTAKGEGASICIRFGEALFTLDQSKVFKPIKENRAKWDGLWFFGKGDCFKSGAKKAFFTNLDYQAGRFISLEVSTKEAPLALEGFSIVSSGYPLQEEGSFKLDAKDDGVWREMLVHTVRQCAHDTYMDCPHYERQMYLGDTRLQILVTYLLTRDRRLPRKSLLLMAEGQLPNGMLRSRFPDRHSQIIPPFSLWWIAMLDDYAKWNDDAPLVRFLLPVAERVLDVFFDCEQSDGLVNCPQGWNYYDWATDDSWKNGMPPGHDGQPGALLNWHFAMTLETMSRLEKTFGTAAKAKAFHEKALKMAEILKTRFYDKKRGLFSDDAEHKHFSQHTQLLAILSGLLKEPEKLYKKMMGEGNKIAQCTIYFSHYLFEAMRMLGDTKAFLKALDYWRDLPKHGFTTTPERPEPARSDCHAWGAHPYYSVMTFLAGVTPRGYGAKEFDITLRDDLPNGFSATIPLPVGDFSIKNDKDGLEIDLPEDGVFWLDGERMQEKH